MHQFSRFPYGINHPDNASFFAEDSTRMIDVSIEVPHIADGDGDKDQQARDFLNSYIEDFADYFDNAVIKQEGDYAVLTTSVEVEGDTTEAAQDHAYDIVMYELCPQIDEVFEDYSISYAGE